MAAKGLGFDQGCYERALALSELRYDDSADDEAFDFVIDQIDECERLVGEYVEGNGYKSEAVRGAIREWGAGFAAELGALRWKLEAGRRIVSDGRAVMRQARDLFNEKVPAELLTDAERWLQGINESFTIPLGECLGLAESGTYFGALEAERNQQREKFCQGLLDQVNDKLNKASKALQAVTAKVGMTPVTENPCRDRMVLAGLVRVVRVQLVVAGRALTGWALVLVVVWMWMRCWSGRGLLMGWLRVRSGSRRAPARLVGPVVAVSWWV